MEDEQRPTEDVVSSNVRNGERLADAEELGVIWKHLEQLASFD